MIRSKSKFVLVLKDTEIHFYKIEKQKAIFIETIS